MVAGHKRQIQLLDLHIRAGTVSHAYLFSGPRHAGKMRVALQMVSSLLCADRPAGVLAFCGRCVECRGIAAGTHHDVHIEDTYKNEEDNQARISIEHIRRMRELAGRSAYGGTHVFIVRDASRLTREAANAFLKILEEPRGNTLFILLAEFLEDVLPTIRSRVWNIRFWPVLEQGTIPLQENAALSLFSVPFADRLRYADTLRDNPDRMQMWYTEAITQASRALHESLLSYSPHQKQTEAVFLAHACRSLIEGRDRFTKPYGTKRILFESDILRTSSNNS